MKKYWRLLIVAIIVLAVGISIAWMNYAAAQKIVAEMPGIAVNYVNDEGQDTYIVPNKSGYNWESYNEQTRKREWNQLGPNKFFSEQDTLQTIPIEGDTITLSISGQQLPDKTVMKRWPDSEWTPGDTGVKHSAGTNVDVKWYNTSGRVDSTEIPIEQGSLYAIWVYFGDAWVEYSFLVPAEDTINYDYLGYISGFDELSATQFELDPIEMISMSNAQRIAELNLNLDDDFPSGFYIYNPTHESIELRLTDQSKYRIINPDTGNTLKTVDKSEFFNHLNQSLSFSEITPFWISETDGNIEVITEQYLP